MTEPDDENRSSGILSGLKISRGSKPSEKPAGRGATRTATGDETETAAENSNKFDSSAPYHIAQSVIGSSITYLKDNGPLVSYLAKWPRSHVRCANFISACLEKVGLISHNPRNDSVRGLIASLRNDPHWQQIDLEKAKPGDVVCFNLPGEGPMSHVVMFAGWQNGTPRFIGSNNINIDGTQRIIQSPMNYPINSIFQYQE